jgi:hypothetical protein
MEQGYLKVWSTAPKPRAESQTRRRRKEISKLTKSHDREEEKEERKNEKKTIQP